MRILISISEKLKKNKETLAVAESCTGGLLSEQLTAIPGSSQFFKLGIIAYSNDAKKKLLNVSESTLKKCGSVSQPTACAMAKGILKILKTDYALAVTGIAGPTGATRKKPIGLVFMVAAKKNKIIVERAVFKGSRQSIRKKTAYSAFHLLSQLLAP